MSLINLLFAYVFLLGIVDISCENGVNIDCLERTPQETTEINCTIEITNASPEKYTSNCPRGDILQIVGEYGVLVIQCSAQIPLDLDYDGFQPTEAVKTAFWKVIQSNSDHQLVSYNLRIDVYSNEALFQYYKKSSGNTNIIRRSYSRTGRYTVRGVFNRTLSRSMYLFLEDGSEQALMKNSNTLRAKLVEPKDGTLNGKYLFPCRPSHFNSTLKLFYGESEQSSIEVIQSDPTTGLVANVENVETNGTQFECRITTSGYNNFTWIKFNISPISTSTFAFEKLPTITSENVTIYHEIQPGQTTRDFFLNMACTVPNPEAAYLSVIEAKTPSQSRLVQEFVLPQYASLSYSLQLGKASSPPGLFTAENVPFSGVILCSSDEDYKVDEYATGFEKTVRRFKLGTDWSAFDISGSPPRNHLQIGPDSNNDNVTYYVNQTYSFKCRIRTHGLVPPAVWYHKTKDNGVVEEFVDYKLKDGYSFHKVKVVETTEELTCAASFWDRDHWKNVSIHIVPRVATYPIFNNTNEKHASFTVGLKLQAIRCSAFGDPPPKLSWLTTSTGNFRETTRRGVSTLEFPSVTAADRGNYTCVAKNIHGEATETFTVDVEEEDDGTVQIIIIVVVVLLAILAVVGTFVYFRYFRKEPLGLTAKEIEEFENGYIKSALTPITGENAQDIPYDKGMEVNPENFQIARSEILGSGAYGIVYRGILRGEQVAVKTVKPDADKAYLKALLSELKIMIYLGKHEHLISLQGASTSELRKGSILVFVEFCALGNLEGYLRRNRDCFIAKRVCNDDDLNADKMSIVDLHQWSYQVCQGMAYLAEKKVIHGDLATRNILLMSDKTAKITDFGLSRQLYNYASYVKKNEEPLPWRWMALESLRDLSFSCKSDIWSFGIVLWEIYSLAEVPYPGLGWDLDFVRKLENGLRMGQPKYSPATLYENILIHCWHSDPSRRPSLNTISAYLFNIWQPNSDGYANLTSKPKLSQKQTDGKSGYQNVMQTSVL